MSDDLRRLAEEQRDKARAQARRIIGNCSGESLVEAIADIAMFGEFDPLKPWHVRALAAAQGTPVARTDLHLNIIVEAYAYDLTETGEVWGLVAGDHGFEDTGIRIDPRTMALITWPARTPPPPTKCPVCGWNNCINHTQPG